MRAPVGARKVHATMIAVCPGRTVRCDGAVCKYPHTDDRTKETCAPPRETVGPGAAAGKSVNQTKA